MIVNCTLESRPTLISSKGNRGNGSATIVNGNCEPTANAKASRFLEQLTFRVRARCQSYSEAPPKWTWIVERLHNYGIGPLILPLQIV
ncbi:hypothetical protein SAMN05216525_101135 [Bradyrhizobium sp. Gha]|nr:hypothetical protein SAMN05216525_101135 [Bradyrhizobium sp. Gha]